MLLRRNCGTQVLGLAYVVEIFGHLIAKMKFVEL